MVLKYSQNIRTYITLEYEVYHIPTYSRLNTTNILRILAGNLLA